ncbi:MAG: hypothetical protein SFU86_22470 [Pirellulaceae bacterium]|nr:hypothetical protein [Pirellulaceae bacterium]
MSRIRLTGKIRGVEQLESRCVLSGFFQLGRPAQHGSAGFGGHDRLAEQRFEFGRQEIFGESRDDDFGGRMAGDPRGFRAPPLFLPPTQMPRHTAPPVVVVTIVTTPASRQPLSEPPSRFSSVVVEAVRASVRASAPSSGLVTTSLALLAATDEALAVPVRDARPNLPGTSPAAAPPETADEFEEPVADDGSPRAIPLITEKRDSTDAEGEADDWIELDPADSRARLKAKLSKAAAARQSADSLAQLLRELPARTPNDFSAGSPAPRRDEPPDVASLPVEGWIELLAADVSRLAERPPAAPPEPTIVTAIGHSAAPGLAAQIALYQAVEIAAEPVPTESDEQVALADQQPTAE